MSAAVLLRDAVSLSGGFPLLAGVNLTVAEGEIVHLRGPNGAGKTSLLRACAGLVPIASGAAVVLGHDLRNDRESLRPQVGLLGHAGFLYDDLTVEENVRFAVRAARGDTSGVSGALERLALTGRLARTRVAKLSAGQRRRTALAVLVARRPLLWLLDEPHAGLDEPGRIALEGLVAELSATGTTVVLASHELDRAAAIADRVVAMAGGRVVADQPGGRVLAGSSRCDPERAAGRHQEVEPRGGPPGIEPEVAAGAARAGGDPPAVAVASRAGGVADVA